MSLSISQFENGLKSFLNVISVVSDGFGHVIWHLKSMIEMDPRIASGTLFFSNFLILEVAQRLSKWSVEFFFSIDATAEMYTRWICEGCFTLASNLAIRKILIIPIHPLIHASLVFGAYIIKEQLKEYFTRLT